MYALKDHPRSRGVYAKKVKGKLTTLGSSPLARGLLIFASPEFVANRIIPARAGFTIRDCSAPGGDQDHPRSRGVYEPWLVPLVVDVWIIPARAGFTLTRS